MRNLKETIEAKYPNGFSLYSLMNDKLLRSNVDSLYLPKWENYTDGEKMNNLLEAKSTVMDPITNSVEKIQYLYFSKSGDLRTFMDDRVIQVPINPVGFIARISVTKQNFIPEALNLDYLIDISKIRYNIYDTYYRNGNDIISAEGIIIESINIKDYSGIDFHPYIKDFFNYKKEIFGYYFK